MEENLVSLVNTVKSTHTETPANMKRDYFSRRAAYNLATYALSHQGTIYALDTMQSWFGFPK